LTSALDGGGDQLHTLAALLPERKPPVVIEWEAGWAPDAVKKRTVGSSLLEEKTTY
jgi:hypothetical protein